MKLWISCYKCSLEAEIIIAQRYGVMVEKKNDKERNMLKWHSLSLKWLNILFSFITLYWENNGKEKRWERGKNARKERKANRKGEKGKDKWERRLKKERRKRKKRIIRQRES